MNERGGPERQFGLESDKNVLGRCASAPNIGGVAPQDQYDVGNRAVNVRSGVSRVTPTPSDRFKVLRSL